MLQYVYKFLNNFNLNDCNNNCADYSTNLWLTHIHKFYFELVFKVLSND